MRFSKHQTRARPSQGGPFHQPVTPPISTQLAAVRAERFAFQSYAEASPGTPLAPPVSNGVQALVKCFGCGHVVARGKAHQNMAYRLWWCDPCAKATAPTALGPDPVEPTYPIVTEFRQASWPAPTTNLDKLKPMKVGVHRGTTAFAPPPAAPPVDEELERERARLVGKRVHYKWGGDAGQATGVYRDPQWGICASIASGGFDVARDLDPHGC